MTVIEEIELQLSRSDGGSIILSREDATRLVAEYRNGETALVDSIKIGLSPTQRVILTELSRKVGKIHSRHHLMDVARSATLGALGKQMSRFRQSLRRVAPHIIVHNERSLGYWLEIKQTE